MLVAFLWQAVSGKSIVKDALNQIGNATSLALTLVKTTEEFKGSPRTERIWWRKGGYLRIEEGPILDVGTPKGGWSAWADKKTYMSRPALPASFKLDGTIGLDFMPVFPVIGKSTTMTWHGFKAIRVEFDGRQMTKETKLYVFFDPKTHLPDGVSANLGSITQVLIFKDLKVSPKIDDAVFKFEPSPNWKRTDSRG